MIDPQKRKEILRKMVRNPANAEALKVLEEMYLKNRTGTDPYETYFNLGQADIVEMLLELREDRL